MGAFTEPTLPGGIVLVFVCCHYSQPSVCVISIASIWVVDLLIECQDTGCVSQLFSTISVAHGSLGSMILSPSCDVVCWTQDYFDKEAN